MSYLLPRCWAGDGTRPNHYVLIPGYPVVFNLFRHSLPMAGVQILSIQLRPKWGALSSFPVWAVGARPFECLLGALRPKMDGIRLVSIFLLPDWGWLEACLNGVPYSVDPISCLDDLYDAPSVRIPAYEPHRIAVEAIPPDANDGFFERFVQQHVLSVEEIVGLISPILHAVWDVSVQGACMLVHLILSAAALQETIEDRDAAVCEV